MGINKNNKTDNATFDYDVLKNFTSKIK